MSEMRSNRNQEQSQVLEVDSSPGLATRVEEKPEIVLKLYSDGLNSELDGRHVSFSGNLPRLPGSTGRSSKCNS